MSFTKGPWKRQPASNLNPSVGIFAEHGPFVAQTVGGNDEANAHLIAAAPELLEALKSLTEAAEFDFCGESTNDCSDDECVAMEDGSSFTFGMIRGARAVISKAEGTL